MRATHAAVFVIVALAAASAGGATTDSLKVEARSSAVANGRLVEDIGIETLGGVFTPLLERRRAVPCEVTQTFSTAADNQAEIEIRLFRGVATLARDAKSMGRFVVASLPRGARGTVNVAVTISVTADGTIALVAKEKSGRPVQLRRRGS